MILPGPRPGHALSGRILVALGMTVFVVAGYGVVVLGAGAVLGVSGRPSIALAVLATALVAVGLDPVRSWLRARLLTSPLTTCSPGSPPRSPPASPPRR